MKSKKGFQLMEVPSLVIVLIVIALLLGISASILQNVRDGDSDTTTASAFYVNSTKTFTNASGSVMYPSSLLSDSGGKQHIVSCSGMKAVNVTNGVKITSQFSVSNCGLVAKNASVVNAKVRFNFTYVYNVYGNGYNVTQEGLDGTKDFSEWQGTFVILIASAVVIGIVGKYLFFG